MADWLVLARWEGALLGRRYRYKPGMILDDEQDPVDDAIAGGAAIVPYDATTMAVAVERFLLGQKNDPKNNQTIMAALERESALPSSVANATEIATLNALANPLTMVPLSTEPTGYPVGGIYLDDGTNTTSTDRGFRVLLSTGPDVWGDIPG